MAIRAGGVRLHAVFSIALLAAVAIWLVSAESAAAKPLCQGQKATIKGTPDGETIKGTEKADVIRARAGNDTIVGLGGNDLVCSGKGADNADGAEGNDSVNGGEGNDQANGGGGDDRLVMHSGEDKVNGGAGVDECRSDEHSECEADLRLNVSGPGSVTHGSEDTFTFNVNLHNNGPTDAVNTRVDLNLPDEPAPARIGPVDFLGTVEYVPEESDGRCGELDDDTIRCIFGGLGTGNDHRADVTLRFPDCFGGSQTRDVAARDAAARGAGTPLPEEAITGLSKDTGTNDPVGSNDADTHTFTYAPDEICFR